jgi:hypothetical protein
MPQDPNVPTRAVTELCACPVDWTKVDGFNNERPAALELLLREWVRCVSEVSVSSDELRLIEDVLFDEDLYEPPHEQTLINLQMRRPLAEALYLEGVGRLGRLRFLRPSEQGKHFSAGGGKPSKHKISYFYRDLQSSTIACLFWSWFEDTMQLVELDMPPPRHGPFAFLHASDHLWSKMCNSENFRIAMNTCAPIGEQAGKPLESVAIDLDLQGGLVAHAYPVTNEQADVIMRPLPVRPIKSREY